MVNVVEIVVQGTDATGPGLKSAANNMKTLTGQTRQMGRAFTEVGQIANVLGNQHFANLAFQTSGLIQLGETLVSTFRKISLLRATLIGAAVIAGGFMVSKFMDMKDAAEKATEAEKKLVEMTEELRVQTLKAAKAPNAAEMEATLQHKRRLQQIQELSKVTEDAVKIGEAAEAANTLNRVEMMNLEMSNAEIMAQFKTDLDRTYQEGRIRSFMDMLETEKGAELANLEGRQQFLEVYKEMWLEAHRSMFSYVAEGTKTIVHGLSDSVVDVLFHTKSAADAFKELGMSIARMFATWAVNRAIAFAAERVMQAIGLGLAAATTKAVTVLAAATAAAWAPAATASLIATFGSSASAAGLLAPLMAANSAAASGMALAAGVAHGGMTSVPRESTYLLDRGERILSPSQNEDFTDFIAAGGRGQPSGATMELDGVKFGKLLYQMSVDGRLKISSQAIV